MKSWNRERGYSLPELLVVVAIVGILALVVVPNFLSFIRANKIKSSLRQVSSDIRATRQIAITEHRRTMLSYTTGASARTYRIYEGTTDSTGVTTYNVTKWNAATNPDGYREKQIEDGVTLSTTTFANVNDNDGKAWNDIVFAPDGTIENIPTGEESGTLVIFTDAKIAKPTYTLSLYLTGRLGTS